MAAMYLENVTPLRKSNCSEALNLKSLLEQLILCDADTIVPQFVTKLHESFRRPVT